MENQMMFRVCYQVFTGWHTGIIIWTQPNIISYNIQSKMA